MYDFTKRETLSQAEYQAVLRDLGNSWASEYHRARLGYPSDIVADLAQRYRVAMFNTRTGQVVLSKVSLGHDRAKAILARLAQEAGCRPGQLTVMFSLHPVDGNEGVL